ncbi:MAG: hypothetical protein LBH65_06345, partial [Desulfovibrio sp.]|nr:hypothetical protein [Desulfovibrio sp.]
MAITRELVKSVRGGISENPYFSIARLAEDLHAPEADIVISLPLSMRVRASVDELGALWRELPTWQPLRVTMTPMPVLSGTGPVICRGTLDKSLQDDNVLGQYVPDITALQRRGIGSAWFITNALLSEESYSLRLYDNRGRRLLSVFLCMDKHGRPYPESLEAFEKSRKRFGVRPTPKMHCKGCGKCTCGGR